jgi:FKBP-type peptidyl-prolyl cis-trans isomerase SlyD
MQIGKDSVVRFHYSVGEVDGPTLETSRGREPLAALIGHRNIIPGLEEAMIGRAAGDRFEVVVAPDKAYGERQPDAVQRVPKKHFRKELRLRPGMQTMVQTNQGPRPVTVVKVGMTVVDVDLNHPMAGKTLNFDVEVIDVREASAEEIAHRHAHGEGGAQH